ncbi:hypothetical protein [Cognataquiflexum aquatile]|uniref:hypothetical protein n=1 Tax=Cognataquiflexum aquatile TaxID=2249427 RepID=UPI001300264F|nr:hypothetical protein [Cognataquiflexum aquatile]
MVLIFLVLFGITGFAFGTMYLFSLKKKNKKLEDWMEYYENKFELLKLNFSEKCKEVKELEKINYELIKESNSFKMKYEGVMARNKRILKIKKLEFRKKEKDIIIEYFVKTKNNQ